MELKRPTLIEEQIDTLVSHGVLIADREGIGIKDARGSDSTGIVCCLCWINTCHLEPQLLELLLVLRLLLLDLGFQQQGFRL